MSDYKLVSNHSRPFFTVKFPKTHYADKAEVTASSQGITDITTNSIVTDSMHIAPSIAMTARDNSLIDINNNTTIDSIPGGLNNLNALGVKNFR